MLRNDSIISTKLTAIAQSTDKSMIPLNDVVKQEAALAKIEEILEADTLEKSSFDELKLRVDHMLSLANPTKQSIEIPKILKKPQKKTFEEYGLINEILNTILSLLPDHERISSRSVSKQFKALIDNIPLSETYLYAPKLKFFMNTAYHDRYGENKRHTYSTLLKHLNAQPRDTLNEIAVEMGTQAARGGIVEHFIFTSKDRYTSFFCGTAIGIVLATIASILLFVYAGSALNETSLGTRIVGAAGIPFSVVLLTMLLSMAINEARRYCVNQSTQNRFRDLLFFSSDESDSEAASLTDVAVQSDDEAVPLMDRVFLSDTDDEDLSLTLSPTAKR